MSSFSTKLVSSRPCRYVFKAHLWDIKRNKFGANVDVLLDTGCFNTLIHEDLAALYGTVLPQKMKVSVGGFSGEAQICVLQKIKIGEQILEKVIALVVPFDGELKDHSMLGVRSDGTLIFLMADSGEPDVVGGIPIDRGREILIRMGAEFTLNMDGGSSSQMFYDGTVYNPGREVGTVIIVW